MVAIFYRDCHPSDCSFCGGALIRPNWVVTAAHCAVAVGGNTPIDVFLGTNNLTDIGEIILVSEVIIHEDFDPNTLDNDLALLRLDFNSKQKTIPIIKPDDPDGLTVPDSDATIIGWGRTSEGGSRSEELLEVTVPIITNQEASEAYEPLGSVVTGNMIAAGITEGGKDACQGDSGGPLLVKDQNDSWILVGVTSWGIGCARPGHPGIYTRLSNYNSWIKQKIVMTK